MSEKIKASIVAIAKLESQYIEEWVNYHLALGFDHIYLYDNEDSPTYASILKNKDQNKVTVIHYPGKNYHWPVQHMILDDFTRNRMTQENNTHVVHIDIDEFIVIKKHETIKDFIREYFIGDCGAIGINMRFFGSSGHTEPSLEPVTQRFTMREKAVDPGIKTIFAVEHFGWYPNVHYIIPKEGYYLKSTSGQRIKHKIGGCHNYDGPCDMAQLNHYKSRTLPEFIKIRSRGRADYLGEDNENVMAKFIFFDRNEEDLLAKEFYRKHCMTPD